MKKIVLSLLIFFGLFLVLNNVSAQNLFQGMRSDEIKSIQEILSEDSEIYPQGLKTGYFGHLTEGAIKRLQEKLGLPKTGIIDDETRKFICPEISLTLLSPNGGETWDRVQIQQISWEVKLSPTQEDVEKTFGRINWVPGWFRVKIELYRQSGERIKQIGNTNLFATRYNWRITDDIPNGTDYIIKISSVPSIEPLLLIYPSEPTICRLSLSDQSDNPFSITGEIPVCPVCQPIPSIQEAIELIKEAIAKLNEAIRILSLR